MNAILKLGIFYFILNFVMLIVGFTFAAINMKGTAAEDQIHILYVLEKYSVVLAAISGAIMIVLLYFYYKRRKINIFRDIPAEPVKVKSLLVIALYCVLLEMVITYLTALMPNYKPEFNYINFGHIFYIPNALRQLLIYWIFFISILVPTLEEILYRGILFNRLKNKMNIIMAAVFSAFIFAIGHGNYFSIFSAFFVGLLFAILFTWYKSIVASIIAHISCNLTSIFLSSITMVKLYREYGEYLALIALIGSLICLRYIYNNRCRQETVNNSAIMEDIL